MNPKISFLLRCMRGVIADIKKGYDYLALARHTYRVVIPGSGIYPEQFAELEKAANRVFCKREEEGIAPMSHAAIVEMQREASIFTTKKSR